MKPLGVSLTMTPDGPAMRVTPSDRVSDAVWDVVRDALAAGWTVERFRRECAQAWQDGLRTRANEDMQSWS